MSAFDACLGRRLTVAVAILLLAGYLFAVLVDAHKPDAAEDTPTVRLIEYRRSGVRCYSIYEDTGGNRYLWIDGAMVVMPRAVPTEGEEE